MSSETEAESKESISQWELDVAAMTGSLMHEIKNPLSTLHINTQLLLEEWKDGKGPKEKRTIKRLQLMSSELNRLQDIINSFTKFTEKHELNLKEGSLNDLLENLIDFFKEAVGRNGIEIRSSFNQELPRFLFDKTLIRQAFLNLMKNAQEAMDHGGELMLKTYHDAQWVYAEVIDTGCGICAQPAEKVFDLYYSTKEGGSGIGLAGTRRIIREHGGDITVQSEESKGTQFQIRLPINRESM